MPEHKHILVVDDESQISRVLRTSLSSHGYDIRVANDGETALEIMKDWTPDPVSYTHLSTGRGRTYGARETYGVLNTSWDGSARPALTARLRSLIGAASKETRYLVTPAITPPAN